MLAHKKNQVADMNGAQKDVRKHRLVRFLEDVPEFLGMDGEDMGPFGKGEVANLEKEIVGILGVTAFSIQPLERLSGGNQKLKLIESHVS